MLVKNKKKGGGGCEEEVHKSALPSPPLSVLRQGGT